MAEEEYLLPRLVAVKPTENWTNNGAGLSFVFPISGAGYYGAGAATERLIPGDVLVLSGSQVGRIGALGGQQMAFWWFGTCFEHLVPLFANRELYLLHKLIDWFKEARLYPASDLPAKECHRLMREVRPECSLGLRSQLLRVVATIFGAEFQKVERERSGLPGMQQPLLKMFETVSVGEVLNLPMQELARKLCCSQRHLNRLFHRHFGLSVAALRMEMRILKAISLLRNPQAKVVSVAGECGFNHLGLFNTCFKRRFGVSPGQWRKAAAAVQTASRGEVSLTCPMKTRGLCPWSEKLVEGEAKSIPQPPPKELARNGVNGAGRNVNQGLHGSISEQKVVTKPTGNSHWGERQTSTEAGL